MSRTRAVLFDLGGTLYDYATLEPGNREALTSLARWAGCQKSEHEIAQAHRDALRDVFYDYLPRSFYLHRDLFRDALLGMAKRLGLSLTDELFERHRELQRHVQARDFQLRDGVLSTLESLRARGCYLGIVSNIDDDQLEQLIALGELEGRFDDLLSSEAARSCKPDRAIFEEALRRATCAPEDAFFVGDTRLQDIDGANRMGIRSVLLWHRDDRSPSEREPHPRHVIRRIPDLLDLVT